MSTWFLNDPKHRNVSVLNCLVIYKPVLKICIKPVIGQYCGRFKSVASHNGIREYWFSCQPISIFCGHGTSVVMHFEASQ